MNKSTLRVGHGSQGDSVRAQFWRQTLRDWSGGGQSIRAFCRARGLSEPSFYAWRRTLAEWKAAPTAADAPRPAPAFVPVHLVEATAGRMEITLAGGTRIRLRGPVDRQALADVVAALAAAGREEA